MTPIDDTTPAAQAILIAGYRAMTPAQRLHAAIDLRNAALTFAAAGIRMRHPGIGERELQLRLGSLWLSREVMVHAYGWDPVEHGLG